MKTKVVIGILVLMMAFPAISHGFGLLKYITEGIRNQLGLDRGPIPKIYPPHPPTGFRPYDLPLDQAPDVHRMHIQAQGF